MEVGPTVQWITFILFAFIAVAGALGMTTTMSMFRSGIFLMASFIGVAGLFILLLADLLALLQVMMYIGGMLVMILYMLLFSNDPGGAMMSSHMKLMGPEKWFSLGLAHHQSGQEEHGGSGQQHEGHEEDQHQHGHAGDEQQERQGGQGQEEHQHHGHQHGGHGGGHSGGGDMSMFTSIKRPAAVLAVIIGVMLVAMLLWRPSWATVPPGTLLDQDSPRRIGHMLMGKYMIAFEGAGLLILLGIFGAVLVQRPARHPDSPERNELQAAVEETPAPVEVDPLEPLVVDLRPEHPDEQSDHENRARSQEGDDS